MRLRWLGHSCFVLEDNEYRVIFDPYKKGSVPGLAPVCEEAEEVLISHGHGDHNGGECVKVCSGKKSPFRVTALESCHDDRGGKLRGMNTIFLLEKEGFKMAHLGDLGCMPGEEVLEKLKGLDLLLVPVGGYYTIDGKTAADLVKTLMPKLAVPMHYSEGTVGYDEIAGADPFLEAFASETRLSSSELDTDACYPTMVVKLMAQNRM